MKLFLWCVFNLLIAGHQFFIPADLIPVFFGDQQHSKTFSLKPVQMFVMHFMGPTDGSYISRIAFGKPFKPLVNDYVMHQEIGKTVGHDAKANCLHPPNMIICAEEDQQYAWNS